MITVPARRVLPIVAMVAACGCDSGSVGPVVTPAPPAPPPVVEAPVAPPPGRTAIGPAGRRAPTAEMERFATALGGRAEPAPMLLAKAVDTGDPELDPLVSFLRASFAREIAAGKKLIIEDHVDLHLLHRGESYDEMVASLMKEASEQVPAEMIRDFCDKNRPAPAPAVWPEITRHVPAVLLNRQDERAIFSKDVDDNWKRFYERFPDAACRVGVSRVGLGREKDRALFYMGFMSGPERGGGHLYVLRKQGDAWAELPVRIGAGWES